MAAKRKPSPKKQSSPRAARGRSSDRFGLRRVAEPNIFELVAPRCVRDRQDDLEEVRAMLEAGEIEVAVEELRWLLDGCNVLLEAHKLLGEVALGEDDLPLARNHFGYAYELGREALGRTFAGMLPYSHEANQPFLEAGKGLAWSLHKLGETELAREVIDQLLALDLTDPLALRALLAPSE